jgi:hypothetical protein
MNFLLMVSDEYDEAAELSIDRIETLYPQAEVLVYHPDQVKAPLSLEDFTANPIFGSRGEFGYRMYKKPFCMLDALQKVGRPLVYLDADAFLIQRLDDFDGFDVGVMLREPREDLSFPLNSGVLIFRTRQALPFVQMWIAEMEENPHYQMEQRPLNTLIQKNWPTVLSSYDATQYYALDYQTKGEAHGITVAGLPTCYYNNYTLRNVRIVHMKAQSFKNESLEGFRGIL